MSTTVMRATSSKEDVMAAGTMKAIVQNTYGSPDTLELQEVEKPAIGDDSVLVRVRAASVSPADWRPMRGKPYLMRPVTGLRRPKNTQMGTDVAGIVEVVGQNVTALQPGEEVFGACHGALAEYVCGTERNFVSKPANVTFEQAGAIAVAGCTALQALRDQGRLQPGQRVLINGAAGGVGTFAVQIAKAFGAEITGVCSPGNVGLVRSLGAAHIVDYTREDFSKSGQLYDLIVDNVGNRSLRHLRRVLTPKGTLVIVGAKKSNWMLGLLGLGIKARLVSPFVGQRLTFFVAKVRNEDLVLLKELIEAGEVTPAIDHTYTLSEVPEAFRYVEGGHARAKVIITI